LQCHADPNGLGGIAVAMVRRRAMAQLFRRHSETASMMKEVMRVGNRAVMPIGQLEDSKRLRT